MQLTNYLLYIGLPIALLIILARVSVKKFWKIPLLSSSRGDQKIFGKVSEIKELIPGVYEVGLEQEVEVKGVRKGGLSASKSAHITNLVHIRGSKEDLPPPGKLIEANTTNTFYRLTGRSINWVKNWIETQSIPFSSQELSIL